MKGISTLLLASLFVSLSAFSQVAKWKNFASGVQNFFAIKSDGTLWGVGGYASRGDGSEAVRNIPIQIGNDTTWASVMITYNTTHALKKDSTLWGWGNSGTGELGNGIGSNNPAPITLNPVQIGIEKWLVMTAGLQTTFGIRKDSTLWGWGDGTFSGGGIGDGTTQQRTFPVQFGTAKNWVKVSAGKRHTLAIKSDGTLWAWGYNLYGQLGDGTNSDRLSPVQVGSDMDWADVYGGFDYSLGLKKDGTLWAWGYNARGSLGDGTTIDKNTPEQIGNDNQWRDIGGGPWFGTGVRKDGTLWAWGDNRFGELGDGTTTQRNVPVQISGHDNPLQISRGHTNPYGALLSADGSTFCFTGQNLGQFGNGEKYNLNTVPHTTYDCQNSFCATYTLASATSVYSLPASGTGNRVDFQKNCSLVSSIAASGTNPVTDTIADSVWIEPTVPVYNGQPYVQRHYGITPSQNASTATATLTLYYTQVEFTAYNAVPNHGPDLPVDAADVMGNKANIRIQKRPGTSNNGTGLFDTYSGGTVGIIPTSVVWNSGLNAWAVTFDVTGFSGFFLNTASIVLPVQLTSLSAKLSGNDGLVAWQTASEENTTAFEVQRSSNGSSFTSVGKVSAAGRSSLTQHYSYTDKGIAALGVPVVYYRLKTIDNDGRFTYSKTVAVNISSASAVATLYPNPVGSTATLQIASFKNETLRCTVVDAGGRTVMVKSFAVTLGSNNVRIDTHALSSGTYTILLRGQQTTTEIKLVKQ